MKSNGVKTEFKLVRGFLVLIWLFGSHLICWLLKGGRSMLFPDMGPWRCCCSNPRNWFCICKSFIIYQSIRKEKRNSLSFFTRQDCNRKYRSKVRLLSHTQSHRKTIQWNFSKA